LNAGSFRSQIHGKIYALFTTGQLARRVAANYPFVIVYAPQVLQIDVLAVDIRYFARVCHFREVLTVGQKTIYESIHVNFDNIKAL
jgi:hypothetical protein